MSYIYILTNDSLPGVIKVGMTTKTPTERAAELHTTGVPTPFLVFAAWKIPNGALKEYEKKAHKALDKFRVSNKREFFKIEPAKAKAKIASIIPTPENIEAERKRANENAIRKLRQLCEPIEQAIAKLTAKRNEQIELINKYQELLLKNEPQGLKFKHAFYGIVAHVGEWLIVLSGIATALYFILINSKHDVLVYAGGALIAYWVTSTANKIITPLVERLEAYRWSLPDPHSVLRDRIQFSEGDIKYIDRELYSKNRELNDIKKRANAKLSST